MSAQNGHFERPPLPVASHRLDLWEPGTFVGATVVCLGGPDHECRWWCDEDTGCEQCGPGGEHRWAPVAYCRIAEWINSCGIDDTHDDNEPLPWDEDGEGQPGIRSGLIETEWTGDDYVWRYPAKVTA